MGDRYRTPDGWAVEVVGLSATPDRNDGERLKVTYYGFFVAVVRTVAELEQWFALSDLEPETLISRRERVSRPVPVRRGPGKRSRGKAGLGQALAIVQQIGAAKFGNAVAELSAVTDASRS
jgi:hypothetical protein